LQQKQLRNSLNKFQMKSNSRKLLQLRRLGNFKRSNLKNKKELLRKLKKQ
jgi:hypothetical protein